MIVRGAIAAVGFSLLALVLVHAKWMIKPPTRVPSGEVHVFLLAGQSNMLGRAPYDGLGDYQDSKVYDWNGERFQQAESPLSGANEGSMGLTVTFADQYLLAHKHVDALAFVQSAVGGTGLNRVDRNWNPGDAVYENAIAEVNSALIANPSFAFKGILWHQGERDDAMSEHDYALAWDRMVSDMRKRIVGADATTPVVLGQIWPTEGEGVRAAIAATPNRMHAAALVTIEGTRQFDDLHFDARSLRILGKRYYEAFSSLQNEVPVAEDAVRQN
ncbi:MAG: sialate O-acetylesterase [Pseudomonadota bacterium]